MITCFQPNYDLSIQHSITKLLVYLSSKALGPIQVFQSLVLDCIYRISTLSQKRSIQMSMIGNKMLSCRPHHLTLIYLDVHPSLFVQYLCYPNISNCRLESEYKGLLWDHLVDQKSFIWQSSIQYANLNLQMVLMQTLPTIVQDD